MASDIEVLIVSYESADVIAACITSVRTAIPGAAIAVREHGNDPAAVARVAAIVHGHGATAWFAHDPTNPGFGAGCNNLAAGSAARWLLFLNPDAVVRSWPWNDEHTPPRGAVVGPVIEGDGRPGDHYGTSYRIVDEIGRSWFRRTGRVPDGHGFVSGAALLIDAERFDQIGGFDPHYFLFYEDLELCRRANAAGIATVVTPDWRVGHLGAHSTRSRSGQSLVWSYESACRFHATGGSSLAGYRAYVVVDSTMRLVVSALLRRRVEAGAYAALARRSLGDLARRRHIG